MDNWIILPFIAILWFMAFGSIFYNDCSESFVYVGVVRDYSVGDGFLVVGVFEDGYSKNFTVYWGETDMSGSDFYGLFVRGLSVRLTVQVTDGVIRKHVEVV